MSDIIISAEPPKPITLSLIGVDYTVRPIKASLGIQLSQRLQGIGEDPEKMGPAIKSLLVTMFGKKDAEKVEKRLYDSDDDLDIPHVMDLLNKLVEKGTGNPTT